MSKDLRNWIQRGFLQVADVFFRMYCFVLRPRRQGVYVVVWCKGKILLVENSYRKEMTLPSGGVKFREPPDAAARRELEEEVGIQTDTGDLVSIGEFELVHDNIRDQIFAYELCLEDPPIVAVDNREVVRYQFATLGDALEKNLSIVARALLQSYS